jgi:hypothetical protein
MCKIIYGIIGLVSLLSLLVAFFFGIYYLNPKFIFKYFLKHHFSAKLFYYRGFLALLSFFLAFYALYNITNNKFLSFIFGIISLISFFWFSGVFINLFMQENTSGKFGGILLILFYIFVFGFFLYYTSKDKIKEFYLYFNLVLYISTCLFGCWCVLKYFRNKIHKILIAFVLYLIILIMGCWAFGSYYYHKQIISLPSNFNKSSIWDYLRVLIEKTITGFFSFPSSSHCIYNNDDSIKLCTMSLIQFYFGKFLDVFLFGYVLSNFMSKTDNYK